MVILVFNQKGGVGKTTTALNLGVALAHKGKHPVTLVDLDPQTHLTASLGYRAENMAWNVADWLQGRAGKPEEIGTRLYLIPGECEQLACPLNTQQQQLPDTEGILIVDAPPYWNEAVSAFMARADWVLSPLEPEFLSVQGISRLLQKMESQRIERDRLRLLICRYDARLAIHREVRGKLQARFKANLLPMVIRNSVRLAESPGYGWSIFDYAPESTGAEDYMFLARVCLKEVH